MTKEELEKYIKIGNEIEFRYKMYSITYYADNRKNYISFYEFYKDTLDVSNADELLSSIYYGYNIMDVLSSLDDGKDLWIY